MLSTFSIYHEGIRKLLGSRIKLERLQVVRHFTQEAKCSTISNVKIAQTAD